MINVAGPPERLICDDVADSELLMMLCKRLTAPDPLLRYASAEDANTGPEGLADFQRSLGVARNILASRLDRFVEAGLMERRQAEGSAYHEYHLTEKGEDLTRFDAEADAVQNLPRPVGLFQAGHVDGAHGARILTGFRPAAPTLRP